MTKIKICGLFRLQDIETINEIRPDYAGFIINYPKSHRSLNPIEAKELTCRLNRRVQAVGVFVDSPIELPIRMLREGVIAMAQLHGSEDVSYIRTLQEKTGCPVIKAFPVQTAEDVRRALESPADFILLDHKLGKNGEVLDWSLLSGIGRPWFLAGGLGPENAADAVRQLHPYAVDLNSALETDGKKDPAKMRAAMAALR